MDWNTVLAAAGMAAAASGGLGGLVHWLVARHNSKVVADDVALLFDDSTQAASNALHGKVVDVLRAEAPKILTDAAKLIADANAPKVVVVAPPAT